MSLKDDGMLQAALSDVWVGVLDDACAREIESTLNFSLRGSCLLKKNSQKMDFEVLAGVF